MTHVFKVKLSLLVLSNYFFFGLHLIPELVYLLFHLRRVSLMPFMLHLAPLYFLLSSYSTNRVE